MSAETREVGRIADEGGSVGRLVLVVTVGKHRCGLLAGEVDEVHRAVEIVPVPLAPDVVEGVVDLRGQVIPVIGLRRRLALPHSAVRPSDRLVFVRLPSRRVALRVDAVLDLMRVQQTGGVQAVVDAPHLQGIARLDDGLLLIHDVAAFLSSEESASLDEALEHAELGRW